MASTAAASKSGLYADPREDWLALHTEEIIEPKRLQLTLSIDAVQINVINVHRWPTIFMDQRKCRAGYFFFEGGFETFGDSLDQRGFAGSQVAAQHDNFRRGQYRRQLTTERNRFFGRISSIFARHAAADRPSV